MIDYDINKDLNIFFSFPDQATPFTRKNNLRLILGLKQEKLKNIVILLIYEWKYGAIHGKLGQKK